MAYSKKLTDEDIAKMHIETLPTKKLEEAMDFFSALKTYRAKEKLYSTYVTGAKKALANTGDNHIYFDYRPEGTITGRLSCGAYKAIKDGKDYPLGLSFHTLPREKVDSIRECCVAPEGYDFITADFKAMELRVLAHIANETNMIKAFNSGADLHRYTASLIYEKDIKNVTDDERQIAKSVSFLVVYGGGAWKLSKTANVSMEVAERTIAKFQEVYPRVFIWMDEVRETIRRDKHCKSLFGRRRNLPDVDSPIQQVRDGCFRQGINFGIQSSASDIVCYGLIDLDKELKYRGLDAYICGTVHDSIELISSKEDTEEVLQIMYNKLRNYPLLKSLGFNFKVPLEIEVCIGNNFAAKTEVKFSSSGSIINREGILQGAIQ